MRIGLILPGGVDPSGTHRVIPCILWLLERLAAAHDVRVFALRQASGSMRYRLLGAWVWNIGHGGSTWRLARTLLAEHRRSPFDVLHVFWGGRHAAAAALAGRWLRRPVLLHLAGGELVSLRDIGYGGRLTLKRRAALRVALHGAARITAACRSVVTEGERLGVRIERLPLGVALDRWPPLAPRPRDPQDTARLLHVASLNHVKDQETLLRAMALLRDWGVRYRLDVAGEDTLGGTLQRLAAHLGLDSLVRFHGFLPHDRLRPLFEQAHILVVSSLHEGGELVTWEAAVAGVPTVGTAVGHVADLAPQAAVAVPVRDAAALARGVSALVADDAHRMTLAGRAQERVKAEDADWTAQRFEEVYRELDGPRDEISGDGGAGAGPKPPGRA